MEILSRTPPQHFRARVEIILRARRERTGWRIDQFREQGTRQSTKRQRGATAVGCLLCMGGESALTTGIRSQEARQGRGEPEKAGRSGQDRNATRAGRFAEGPGRGGATRCGGKTTLHPEMLPIMTAETATSSGGKRSASRIVGGKEKSQKKAVENRIEVVADRC